MSLTSIHIYYRTLICDYTGCIRLQVLKCMLVINQNNNYHAMSVSYRRYGIYLSYLIVSYSRVGIFTSSLPLQLFSIHFDKRKN